jgi:hypothetical protein
MMLKMDYENFKEQLIEKVRAGLYEKVFEVNVSSYNVDKLNESYDAIPIQLIQLVQTVDPCCQHEKTASRYPPFKTAEDCRRSSDISKI